MQIGTRDAWEITWPEYLILLIADGAARADMDGERRSNTILLDDNDDISSALDAFTEGSSTIAVV